MTPTNSSAASGANEPRTAAPVSDILRNPYGYFRDLNPTGLLSAITGGTPLISDLTLEESNAFLSAALERLFYFTGFRLDKEKSFHALECSLRNYAHWRTADWKLFFIYCCTARYGTLAAFDRENPQVLFSWMNQYDQERRPVLETAKVYFGKTY